MFYDMTDRGSVTLYQLPLGIYKESRVRIVTPAIGTTWRTVAAIILSIIIGKAEVAYDQRDEEAARCMEDTHT